MYQKNDIEITYQRRIALIGHDNQEDWIIGGKEEAEQMIIDLREAIEKLN